MSDIISVFNRLTESQLADCNLFEKILQSHYDKFKYFYYIIFKMEIDKIDSILCEIQCEKGLMFRIVFGNKKNCEKTFKELNSSFDKTSHKYYDTYFDHDMACDSKCIYINIWCKSGEESCIYEDNYSLL